MTTLAEAILAVAECVGGVDRSVASATGTTTTLVDDKIEAQPGEHEGGTIWLLSGTALNLGLTRPILTHAPDGTLTWVTVLPAATAAGDGYAAFWGKYPRFDLVRSVNQALRDLGTLTYFDTTLDSVYGQGEYTLPTGVSNVQRVWLRRYAAEPYGFEEHRAWDEFGGKLVLKPGWEFDEAGCKIRLAYNKALAQLSSDLTELPAGVELARLQWEAAIWLYRNRVQDLGSLAAGQDDMTATFLNEAKEKRDEAPMHSLQVLYKLPSIGF
jgi:hypothetical protein